MVSFLIFLLEGNHMPAIRHKAGEFDEATKECVVPAPLRAIARQAATTIS
jgi:hypothetical protein